MIKLKKLYQSLLGDKPMDLVIAVGFSVATILIIGVIVGLRMISKVDKELTQLRKRV